MKKTKVKYAEKKLGKTNYADKKEKPDYQNQIGFPGNGQIW